LKERIARLKNDKNAVILAHNYQVPQIQDIADCLGDSLELSRISRERPEKMIVFCGVRFMAETAKILSPEKKVLLPASDAGCPLADMITPQQLIDLKQKHPDAWVVSYVNTSADIKALSDVCCTSANAIDVVKNVPAHKVIFVPDRNLGWWVQKNVPEKELIIWEGFCYVHDKFTLSDIFKARSRHPDARVFVHPECRSEVLEEADSVLSTSGMIKKARASQAKEFVIGTESSLIYRLQKDNPEKDFFSLGNAQFCMNMRKTTLQELHDSLEQEKYEITLDAQIISKAQAALEKMVSVLGN